MKIQKINRILRKVILLQLFVLSAVLVSKLYFSEKPAFANHDANTPDVFKVTIKSIALTKGLLSTQIFSGSREVDLAALDSFESILDIDCDVVSGMYDGANVVCGSTVTVKGTVVVDGNTYYTKANHTGHDTGPAEEEQIVTWISCEQKFAEPMEISGQVTLRLIVDIVKVLTYWDGLGGAPTPELGAERMGIVPLPMALVIGEPGSKEIYKVVRNDNPDNGRLALIFDSDDNFLAGMGRALLEEDNMQSIFFTGGNPIRYYTLNDDGTIYLEQGEGIVASTGQPLNWEIPDFKRENHTGHYIITYQGEITTGTYTATVIAE